MQNYDKSVDINGNVVSFRQLPSYNMRMHDHDAVQILVPLEGAHFEITWYTEDKETESKSLGARDICLIPSLLEHSVRWVNAANFISFYIKPVYIRDKVAEDVDIESLIFDARIGFEDELLFNLARSIKDYFIKNEDCNYKYFDSLLTVVSQHINVHYLKDETEPVLFNDYSQIPCEKVRSAILYMNNNLHRNLAVTEIADFIDMSHYHFSRVFKETIGMPPSKFHMMQRIEKAKVMLKDKMPVVDVALSLGFSSQSHFSNVFSRSVGKTPKQFTNY